MPQLNGSSQPVNLGQGYSIRAPGVRGNAEMRTSGPAGAARSRSATIEDGTAELDAALAATNVTEVRQIELTVQSSAGAAAAGGAPLRSVDRQQDVVELAVPDLGPENGQLVLACDESGVLTWHLPLEDTGDGETGGTRGGGGSVKRFLIPATVVAPASEGDTANRGILGAIGKKLLKVLIYPITDPIIGKLTDFFAEKWEARKRPYGLRDFAPANFRDAGDHSLAAADWDRLKGGRSLMFVHGTFSTAHGAFQSISDATFSSLHSRYGGRVFAFNHFSLSHDPEQNMKWLLDNSPDVNMEVDIVCHSRGGLVARTLAEHPAVMNLDAGRFGVRKIVFVGVPNAGTPLANADHMVQMLDRLTTALNLFPTGPVTETLEAIITAVKVFAHAGLKGLDGLAAMQPGGKFLSRLNAGAAASGATGTSAAVSSGNGAQYFAIGADYQPKNDGLKALLRGTVANAVLDRVFEDVANDLVVPEPGVFGVDDCPTFPVHDDRLLRIPASEGVIHTTLFGYEKSGEKMLEWLAAD